jgi:hypothetical protein
MKLMEEIATSTSGLLAEMRVFDIEANHPSFRT